MPNPSQARIKLGMKVRDKVTGLQGIAVAKYDYLYGCTRIGIQPPIGKDGKVPEHHTCDEPQLEIIDDLLVRETKAPRREPGGPSKFIDAGPPVPAKRI